MTREQALDKAAQAFGYENYHHAIVDGTDKDCERIVNRALDLTWNAAIEAAADSAEVFESYLYSVDKQSILKLKR